MDKATENTIRFLGIPQLRVLRMLADASDGISNNKEISSTTHTTSTTLGALLTPLRRKKIKGEPLIIPMGRDSSQGTIWKLNEKIIPKDDLKILLIDMNIEPL
jgi:hypothetical protein